MVGLFIFVIVSTVGGAIEMASLRGASPTLGVVMIAVLSVLVLALRRRRRRRWEETPLVFDDELPSDVQVLGLSE
jgi:membrane protein implicated in regulation of membrane protease activity